MKSQKYIAIVLLGLMMAWPLTPQDLDPSSVLDVTFANLELSPRNQLLFTARTYAPHFRRYSTLFSADLSEDKAPVIRQLTFFPEHITLIRGSNEIQIQNRFGVFRSIRRRATITAVEGIPNFSSGGAVGVGGIMPVRESPDGAYILYFRPHSAVFGSLLLREVASGQEIVISHRVGMTSQGPPTKWSPDSSFFLYSKDNALYYYSVAQLKANRVVSESLRKIGPGSINSIQWVDNTLYLLVGSTLYAIRNQELFARGIYQDLVQIGLIIGTIPFSYNPAFDSFQVAPDGQRIVLIKNRRDLFLHSFEKGEDALRSSFAISYNSFLVDSEVVNIIWIDKRNLLLFTRDLAGDESLNRLYRVRVSDDGKNYRLQQAPETTVRSISISSNRQRVAVTTPNRVYIKNPTSWENLAVHQHPQALTTLWSNEDRIIIAGKYVIEERSPLQEARKIIALSQVSNYGFERSEGRILATSANSAFYFDTSLANWQSSALVLPAGARERPVATEDYRVFLGRAEGSRYRNQIQIRHLNDYRTTALIQPPAQRHEPFPTQNEQVDFFHFRHGSRIRSRKVALALNAVDSVQGLNHILAVLRDYNIRATFFLNGNFIRSYPQETRTIAKAGHESASLFFNYFDMTDIKYQIESRFVQQGLSSTEDLYNKVTKGELSLLWHAPFYFTNPAIIEAAREVGYTYIGRDVVGDSWRGTSTLTSIGGSQQNVWQTIERILLQKKPGSIISMRIGSPADTPPPLAGVGDPAVNLALLLTALMEQGYQVVPVSEIYEEAR